MSTKLEKLTKGLNKQFATQQPPIPTQKPKVTATPSVASALPNAASGVERVTLSLHGTDKDRLAALEDFLRSMGHRESNRSLLVKVALRGVELTPALVDHLRAAQAEDGRRNRTAKAAP